MKKSHKIIVALIFIITVLLIIFLSKNFIIRKYFISILENVDYDEYILELSVNGKKSAIYYYTTEYVMERHYDDNGNLDDYIVINNYLENSQYYYYLKTNDTTQNIGEFDFIKPTNLNNKTLLKFLNDKNTLRYKGITNINNIECYILEFKDNYSATTTIYLSKKLLYTVRIDNYISNNNTNTFSTNSPNTHIIHDYTLDLDLNKKSMFEF